MPDNGQKDRLADGRQQSNASDPLDQRRPDRSGEAPSRDTGTNRLLGLTSTHWVAVILTTIVLFVMNPPGTTQTGPEEQGELAGQFLALVANAFLLVWVVVYVSGRVRSYAGTVTGS